MAGLSEKDISDFLHNWDESEDSSQSSDSEPEDEASYYRSAREIQQDLEDVVIQEDQACENEDPDLITDYDRIETGDPPLVIDNNQGNTSSTVRSQSRPIIWRKRNLFTSDESLVFRGNTQMPSDVLECQSPIDFFRYVFRPELVSKIVEESNLYSTQRQISNPEYIDSNDLNKFLGILIYSSVIHYPNRKLYWNNKFGYDLINKTMPSRKFEKMCSILHFNDKEKNLPNTHPDYDRLYLVRPLIDSLNQRFSLIPMEQRLSIDEQMCATKMSHYMKQYMPNKPHKWGIKLFLICSIYGYAHRLEVYTGRGKSTTLPNEPDLGESGNTVIRLSRMVPRRVNHIIYFDNFYTSLQLMTYLAKEGIYSLGTVRINRLRNCKLPDKKEIMKKNVPRGFYEENVANVDGVDVSAIVWKDNKPVNLLSTYVGAEPATTVTRFDKQKKERVPIPCPKAIREYNIHMGGVDLLDSFIGRYHIRIKSRKWTMRLFYHLLDVAVVNAWLIYKKVEQQNNNSTAKFLNLCQFRLELAESLCRVGLAINSGGKRGRPSSSNLQSEIEQKRRKSQAQSAPSKDVRLDQISHWGIWNEKQERCKYPNCSGFTYRKCLKCGVSLCDTKAKNCFLNYHNN